MSKKSPSTQIQGHDTSETSRTTQKAPRRYAFACTNCRRKKIRCNGEQPHCKACIKAKEACQYPKRSVEVQLVHAQNRIKELEALLEGANHPFSGDGALISRNNSHVSEPFAHSPNGLGDGSSVSESDQDASLWSQVGLDEDGAVTYHGPTSRFHVESVRTLRQHPTESPAEVRRKMREQHLPTLQTNFELLHRVWEPLVRAKTESDFGIAPELATTLLDIYWTWQHPLQNFVYRPCFVMDMALGGPYFSQFLLMSMFSFAAIHASENDERFKHIGRGENFLSKAKQLLLQEIGEKPTIPTIQGLLIIASRQCAVGQSSEGWTYTGMAIRMMTDIGLHLNIDKLMDLERLTPADLECRKRLYFSAFIWDKTLSLALGRPPTLTKLAHSVEDLIDDLDDEEHWHPICIGGSQDGYPSMPQHNTMAMKETVKLGQVITLILASIYSPFTDKANLAEDLQSLESRLYRWYDNSPPVLKIDDAKGLSHCPPPHILYLNLMFHCLLIILYRPFLSTPNPRSPLQERASAICVAQTKVLHDFFVLYGRSFNYKFMTYHISYVVYTAATVDVHEMKSPEKRARDEAASRLNISLRILESEAKQSPCIRRSIDIIKRQLSIHTTEPSSRASRQSSSIPAPAIPTAEPAQSTFVAEPNPISFSNHSALPWRPPYGLVTPGNDNGHAQMMQIDSMGMIPDEANWDYVSADTGAGFQPEVDGWTYGDSLGVPNARTFG